METGYLIFFVVVEFLFDPFFGGGEDLVTQSTIIMVVKFFCNLLCTHLWSVVYASEKLRPRGTLIWTNNAFSAGNLRISEHCNLSTFLNKGASLFYFL